MSPRNLLLCFDAFGTLFRPRKPVAQQYADVARSFGLGGFSNDDVAASFKQAFRQESKRNPNYGKANGMDAEKWWTNIITDTFRPFLPATQQMPQGMVPALIQRFWCDEGYALYSDVLPLVRKLRQAHAAVGSKVVIGIITNSDDRVPDVLSALGMRVGPLRYGDEARAGGQSKQADANDVDFTVVSYDVGHEKPDRRIFAAAEELLQRILATTDDEAERDQSLWRRVYVGDEYEKDVVGAVDAGWNAVLIDRETTRGRTDVAWLDPKPPADLSVAFKSNRAVGFGSLAKLAEWIPPSGVTR